MLAGDLEGAEGESPIPQVAIRVEAANLAGEAISTVAAGEEFFVRAGVRDLRVASKPGVFAAYFDLDFDESRAEVIRKESNPLGFDIEFGPKFGNAIDGNLNTPGLVDEVGAFQTASGPLGAAEVLLFNIRFRAEGVVAGADSYSEVKEDSTVVLDVLTNDSITTGPIAMSAGPADESPGHDVLVFDPPSVIPPDQIYFSTSPVTIVGGPLTITSATQGNSGGVVQVSQDGLSIVYTPAQDFFGTETFEYTVNGVATATVTVEIDPVNDAPRVTDDRYTLEQNETLSPNAAEGVLANDVDPENDAMTARATSLPEHGTLQFADDGSFTYVPETDYRGTDQFAYVANDGLLDSASATVTLIVDPPSVGMRLETVNAAGERIASVEAGQPFHLRAYVEDLRGVPLSGVYATYLDVFYDAEDLGTVASASNPLGFDVEFLSGYTNGKSGDASVPGVIDDVGAFQSSSQPTGSGEIPFIDITLEAAAAVANDDTYTGIPEDSLDVVLAVLGNDRLAAGVTELTGRFAAHSPNHDVLLYVPPDPVPEDDIVFFDTEIDVTPAPDFRITDVTEPDQGGTLAIADDGSHLIYSPAPDFHGIESFSYTAGGSVGSVAVTIDPVNDAPDANADQYRVRENLPLVIAAANGVLNNDQDVDGDTITAELVAGPDHGVIDLASDGGFTYTPPANFQGPDRFQYRVTDGAEFSTTVAVDFEFDPPPMMIRLAATDLAGTAVSEWAVGEPFLVNGMVQDLRPDTVPARGVFAAYLDLMYDESVRVVADAANSLGFAIQFGPDFTNPGTGDIDTPGVVNEVGSFQLGLTPLGPDEALLFSAQFEAAGPRAADDTFAVSQESRSNELDLMANDRSLRWDTVFGADPADESPTSDVLLFEPPEPVPDTDIRYQGDGITLRNPAQLEIVAVGPTSQGGSVSIVTGGGSVEYTPQPGFSGIETFEYTMQTADGSQATATASVDVVPSWHNLRNPLDVNSDTYVQPVDALIVINDLNANGPRFLGSPFAPPFLDVNDDTNVSPVDVLIVINHLNNPGGSGESGVTAERRFADLTGGSLPADTTVAPWQEPAADQTVVDGSPETHKPVLDPGVLAVPLLSETTSTTRNDGGSETTSESLEATIDRFADDVLKSWLT